MKQIRLSQLSETVDSGVQLQPPFELVDDDDSVIGVVIDPVTIDGMLGSNRLQSASQVAGQLLRPRYDEDRQMAALRAEADELQKRIAERSAKAGFQEREWPRTSSKKVASGSKRVGKRKTGRRRKSKQGG